MKESHSHITKHADNTPGEDTTFYFLAAGQIIPPREPAATAPKRKFDANTDADMASTNATEYSKRNKSSSSGEHIQNEEVHHEVARPLVGYNAAEEGHRHHADRADGIHGAVKSTPEHKVAS